MICENNLCRLRFDFLLVGKTAEFDRPRSQYPYLNIKMWSACWNCRMMWPKRTQKKKKSIARRFKIPNMLNGKKWNRFFAHSFSVLGAETQTGDKFIRWRKLRFESGVFTDIGEKYRSVGSVWPLTHEVWRYVAPLPWGTGRRRASPCTPAKSVFWQLRRRIYYRSRHEGVSQLVHLYYTRAQASKNHGRVYYMLHTSRNFLFVNFSSNFQPDSCVHAY